MFEFRLRILKAGSSSFLGVVDGFPQILTESATENGAELDAMNALGDYLGSLAQPFATRVEQDDLPTVGVVHVRLAHSTT